MFLFSDGLPGKYKTDPTLIKTIIPESAEHGKKQIRGLTILNGRLFAVRKWSPDVEVYDSITFCFSQRWNLKEIFRPQDIVSCNRNQCLYINGYIDKDLPSEILKIDPLGKLLKKWSTGDEYGWSLSVTGESNIVLPVNMKNKLKEYSPDGQLVREIDLSPEADIRSLGHAVKLPNDHFLVSHSDTRDGLYRVCIVNAHGNLVKSFDGKRESTIGKMNNPSHLAVDGDGFVMVADTDNGRILLLNRDLKFMRVLISNKRHKLRFPMRILLDESHGRMFVADNESDKAGQIFIFEFCA